MELNDLTSLVSSDTDLTSAQAAAAADLLASAEVEVEAKAKFLTALAEKGESSSEVAGLAGRFRELARDPGLSEWQDQAIDVCGTGGDKQGTFNVSTTVTYVIAAAGIPVFKHGNRSITSKCGSANLLDALGVDLMADDAVLKKAMAELGFCFMFAPAFHPAFKEIMPVRQKLAEQGQRTVFNILGPLINPAKPSYQLLGVFGKQVVELMAGAQHELGLKAGLVAHCDLGEKGGMDEFSVAGTNIARGFGSLREVDKSATAADLGLAAGELSDLEGGDVVENKEILAKLLEGKAPKALEDTVVLNTAAAFFVHGRHGSIQAGYEEARDLLLGGKTHAKIDQTRDFYASL
ncbi:MAG: anthranilate phosphoribosyltransferase [Verrucomicrobiota bacterium]